MILKDSAKKNCKEDWKVKVRAMEANKGQSHGAMKFKRQLGTNTGWGGVWGMHEIASAGFGDNTF